VHDVEIEPFDGARFYLVRAENAGDGELP